MLLSSWVWALPSLHFCSTVQWRSDTVRCTLYKCVPVFLVIKLQRKDAVSRPITYLFAHFRKGLNPILETVPLWCHKWVLMLLADFWQLIQKSSPLWASHPTLPPSLGLPCSSTLSLASSNRFSSVAEHFMCATLMHASSSRLPACKPIVRKPPRWSLAIGLRVRSAHFQAFCTLFFFPNVRQLREKNGPPVLSCLVLLWFLMHHRHRVRLGVAINTDDRGGLLNCKHQTLGTSSCFQWLPSVTLLLKRGNIRYRRPPLTYSVHDRLCCRCARSFSSVSLSTQLVGEVPALENSRYVSPEWLWPMNVATSLSACMINTANLKC